MINLLDKAALISIARNGDHPLAFLVGAPLSGDMDGGVPGVAPMLDLVREEVKARAGLELSRYDDAVAGKSGGDAYRAAMEWLQGNVGQDAVNRVIQTAVLKARRAGVDAHFTGNGDACDWYIPAGTQQLAQLLSQELKQPMNRFPGPILTTNFDPLLSLAIESSGARALWRVVQTDGRLADVRERGAVEVIHLHGFWRGSDTLHTAGQLTSKRPHLRESLRRILKQKTLMVAAYGGWDDVFARTLAEVAADDDAQLNVLWCFRESDAATIQVRYKELLERVAPAITRGRLLCYGGIDCHSIFGEIADASAKTSAVAVATPSPLAGWELIEPRYLTALAPLRPEEVIRYFDGAIPTWRHAMCVDVPRRAAVGDIVRRLFDARSIKVDSSLQLIRAAGGEGKTTLLLQVAAAAASDGWNVLWRPGSRVGLTPEHVAALDITKNWLIVADDAENLVQNVSDSARLLHANGRSHIHFLLASRDTDWRYFQGDHQPWATWLKRHSDILLRELTEEDANLLIEAWRKYGADGLRELESLPDPSKQVAALLKAVRGVTPARDEGSFFGGLLAVRFGPDGLRNHVVSLLTRLKDEVIAKSDHSLFEALLCVAACHAVGIAGINENVLADFVGVPREWVQTLVVKPLGEEAAAVRTAGHVLTRHSIVAATILVAADRDLGADVAEIWSAVVRQTVRTGQDVQMDRAWFSDVVHAGRRIQHALPSQFTELRRKEIAVAAAKAAIAAEPDRLDSVTDLGNCYRIAKDFPAAVQVFRDNLRTAQTKVDFINSIRGYWYEWGVAEGAAGDNALHRGADAWIQGLSLADHLKTAPITLKRAKVSCAGLGLAFGKLAEPRPTCPFARGRRAVAYLGRLTMPDSKTLSYFNDHDHDSDKIGTPRPRSLDEAIGWLMTAVAQAGRELQDPFLKAQLRPEQVSFNMLQRFLLQATSPPARSKYNQAPTANPSVSSTTTLHTSSTTILADLFSEESERKRDAIDRVVTKAWEVVSIDGSPEERLRHAKREALGLIAGLSPSIRRQVSHYFTSQKWTPLIERDPKSEFHGSE